jgi:hypothetical protein
VLAAALVLIAIVPAAARGQARTMSWPALEVEARLDANGDLHVTERQAIRFDGAWNGGERVFRVPPGQRLRFERISREAGDGRLVALARGDLDRVDHYGFTDGHTLRWRSRASDDAPFAAATLIYVLEYTLSGVLAREGDGRYLLHHDFAFPDRAWPIHKARASLDLDPVWQAGTAGPLLFEAGPLVPGKSLVARVPLRWAAAGAGPALPGEGLAHPWREVFSGALAASLAAAGAMLVRHARARGQLAPLPTQVDDAFLREHVLSRPPEVIGAAYDDAVGAPEVAAVLARLSAEGKLETRVVKARRILGFSLGPDVVHLALRADRDAFTDHERSLVDALFVDGDTTDTEQLKAQYSHEGFDPADEIRSALERAVHALAPRGAPVVHVMPWVAAAVLLVVGVLLAIQGGAGPPVILSVHGVVLPLVAIVV